MGLKYDIIGSGAVGGYYGGRLVHGGRDVHFLYRSEYDVVRENGLAVRSCDGDFRVRVQAYDRVGKMPVPDVIVVALKALETPLLADLLPPLIGPATFICTLQNGLGNEEFIAERFGADRVIAGSAFICAEREVPGVIGHYAAGALGLAAFGEKTMRIEAVMDAMIRDFMESGVKCRKAASAKTLKWSKLVWNVPFSGLAVYYDGATTDVVLSDPEKRAFAKKLMREVIAAGRADGAEIADEEVERNFRATEKMGAYRPSMMVDFEKGRPMEIDAIIGEPLRRGLRAGLRLPAWEELHRKLKIRFS